MGGNFSYIDFYHKLETQLAVSTAAKRKIWSKVIIENNLDIKLLSNLLNCEKKIALRFSWLLSEIGMSFPNKLLIELPNLLTKSDQIIHFKFIESFATYWFLSGVPLENESKAIDLLFEWLSSAQTNITTKSRSLKVLFILSKKYPDLKNELILHLNGQIYKNGKGFEKRVLKILLKLEDD